MLCTTALLPYICLNVIHCFPETWDPASGRTDNKDYRRMRIYQYMLKQCTMADLTSEVTAYPHRRFFGIADDQFSSTSDVGLPNKNSIHPYGVMSFDKFLTCDNPRIVPAPAPADVPVVRQILRSMGLPMELVLDIMELAEYEPRGRLQVPNDPFHPANREELDKYLKYCWQVLVRCDMMGAAIGMAIPWRKVVSDVMVRLFTCALHPGPRKLYGRDSEGGTDAWKFL
jgi:hypothetical protein